MKTVVGRVVSNKMTKSVVVAVQRMWQHPRYTKLVRRTSKFMAHDETNACNIGDEVSSFVPLPSLCSELVSVMFHSPVRGWGLGFWLSLLLLCIPLAGAIRVVPTFEQA